MLKKQNIRTISLIVGTLTYLLVGASIFDRLESGEEQRRKIALDELESQMRTRYELISEDMELLDEIVHLDQQFKAGRPWRFAGSLYYATTVLTTIGYGHSTPKTYEGKMFTMIYACIGIPLCLLMFNSIGERLNHFFSVVVQTARRKYHRRRKSGDQSTIGGVHKFGLTTTENRQPAPDHSSAWQSRSVIETDLIMVMTLLTIVTFTTGSVVFSRYEGWSFWHALYYCFITLTTIGFGDYVALQQDNSLERQPEYVSFTLFFIIFGLAIVAAWLNLVMLKFMTLNTADERRDEQEALQAAAEGVHLEGDIILQHHNHLKPNAKSVGEQRNRVGLLKRQETQSVCSCICTTCYPRQHHQQQSAVCDVEQCSRWLKAIKWIGSWIPFCVCYQRDANCLFYTAIDEEPSKMAQPRPGVEIKAESVADFRPFVQYVGGQGVGGQKGKAYFDFDSRARASVVGKRWSGITLTSRSRSCSVVTLSTPSSSAFSNSTPENSHHLLQRLSISSSTSECCGSEFNRGPPKHEHLLSWSKPRESDCHEDSEMSLINISGVQVVIDKVETNREDGHDDVDADANNIQRRPLSEVTIISMESISSANPDCLAVPSPRSTLRQCSSSDRVGQCRRTSNDMTSIISMSRSNSERVRNRGQGWQMMNRIRRRAALTPVKKCAQGALLSFPIDEIHDDDRPHRVVPFSANLGSRVKRFSI